MIDRYMESGIVLDKNMNSRSHGICSTFGLRVSVLAISTGGLVGPIRHLGVLLLSLQWILIFYTVSSSDTNVLFLTYDCLYSNLKVWVVLKSIWDPNILIDSMNTNVTFGIVVENLVWWGQRWQFPQPDQIGCFYKLCNLHSLTTVNDHDVIDGLNAVVIKLSLICIVVRQVFHLNEDVSHTTSSYHMIAIWFILDLVYPSLYWPPVAAILCALDPPCLSIS